MKIDSGFANVNGASLYYEISGKGKPVVFVHGMGLDCRMWNDQFDELSKQFRVIRYDLRGFGKSSLPSDALYSHHADLKELLDHLDIPKTDLIGLSMGGRVITDFALTFPEKTSSLILVDSVLHGFPFKKFSMEKINAAAKNSGAESANMAWLEHELFFSVNNNPSASNALKIIVSSYSGWHWMNKNPWQPLNPPSIEQIHKIKTPTLVIVGQFDLPEFHTVADILHDKISTSKKITMPGVGHMSNMEDPDAFNKLVTDFIISNNKIKLKINSKS